MSKAKKLVLVLTTFLLVIKTSKEDDLALQRVLYVHYPIWFKKKDVQALINLGSKVNTMTSIYISKLGVRVYHINIGAQNIDGSTLKTFGMILASFL